MYKNSIQKGWIWEAMSCEWGGEVTRFNPIVEKEEKQEKVIKVFKGTIKKQTGTGGWKP